MYPAFRLILPDKDRERPMYGLKENTIAKLLIDVTGMNKKSEDAYNLLNWKQPGSVTTSRVAGDFAGRCYQVISKRSMLTKPGTMLIEEVNDLLDELAAASKKEGQLPIFLKFYNRMNADELMWLIRIILRQMKVGATEKTFFDIWHPDADSLFNVSSNLRRVCWELYDPHLRLDQDDRGVTLMQCFQPQLAQFQMRTFQMMLSRMRPTENDPKFWIEEKLDGERMQLHMVTDEEIPGGKRFAFWSRKAKDYTYLYGNGLEDGNSALTRHLTDAFHEGVENMILDGEMITWNLEQDAMVPFGSLKTAANLQQANPYSQGDRPLFKVFDILYLNDKLLTGYTLRDRRRALLGAVKDVPRRLEIHGFEEAQEVSEIETRLRIVIQDSSEGLVLKNPRSAYNLNERNDDWIKVKPEYMMEFGENLDCCVIGGYYGSGRRGGMLSSFLCGLRVNDTQIEKGAHPMKFHSFFKVGGGFTAADYAAIRHHTEGKWKKWDPNRPPNLYIALAGGNLQTETPDEWILPSDSVVIEVKAASAPKSDSFRTGRTLRFPRFKRIRSDRDWQSALSLSEFESLNAEVEQEHRKNQMKMDDTRKKPPRISRKRQIVVAGSNVTVPNAFGGGSTNVFQGLDIYIMTGSKKPDKKSKAEIEELAKYHGAIIHQNDSKEGTICIGENRTVHVASAIKRGNTSIVKPAWIFANIRQAESDRGRPALLLPLEPKHMLFVATDAETIIYNAVDQYEDSFTRDLSVQDLRELFDKIPISGHQKMHAAEIKLELLEKESDLENLSGWLFDGVILYAEPLPIVQNIPAVEIMKQGSPRMMKVCNIARFAGATITDRLDNGVTHILVGSDTSVKNILQVTSHFQRLPRLITCEWIEQSWAEKTRFDEERFVPVGHS